VNLLLLLPEDLVAPGRARITGRRLLHLREVHGAKAGGELAVGMLDGPMGRGRLSRLDADAAELELDLRQEPPPKLPITLLLALPRPKVLDRCIASAASLGVARIVLLNAWKVEKAYWRSPKLDPAHLRQQLILGLEQAKDTRLPDLRLARLFRPFMEDELEALAGGSLRLLAHPGAESPCPRAVAGPLVLAIGPEGGWIPAELESFARAGFRAVDLGPRVLRTETALATLVGRLG
jgi:RsmE family RNA methyltransferase